MSLWVLVWTKAKLTGNANKAPVNNKATCKHIHKDVYMHTVNKEPPSLCSSVIKRQIILKVNTLQNLYESLGHSLLDTVTATSRLV